MEDLLQIVRAHAAHRYDVFGELGRESDSDIWYLGRDLGSAKLVALRLRQVASGSDGDVEAELQVAHELDAAVAVGLGECVVCGAHIRRWIRFCTQCGADLTDGGRIPSTPEGREELLREVRESAAGVYDVLGEMPWAKGAGIVYFAIEKSTGNLVRLRLSSDSEGLGIKKTRLAFQGPDRVQATYLTHFEPSPAPPPPGPDNAISTPAVVGRADRWLASVRSAPGSLDSRLRADPMMAIKVLAGFVVLLIGLLVFLILTR